LKDNEIVGLAPVNPFPKDSRLAKTIQAWLSKLHPLSAKSLTLPQLFGA